MRFPYVQKTYEKRILCKPTFSLESYFFLGIGSLYDFIIRRGLIQNPSRRELSRVFSHKEPKQLAAPVSQNFNPICLHAPLGF